MEFGLSWIMSWTIGGGSMGLRSTITCQKEMLMKNALYIVSEYMMLAYLFR